MNWGRSICKDVGGVDDVVTDLLREAEFQRLLYQERGGGALAAIASLAGVVLCGPSGSGKTLLVDALRRHADCTTRVLAATDVFKREMGESEGTLRAAFAPDGNGRWMLLVIEELDVIAPRGDAAADGEDNDGDHHHEERVRRELLHLLDGSAAKGIFVVAVTRSVEAIDPRVLRPHRLGTLVLELTCRTREQRRDVLRVVLRDAQVEDAEALLDRVAHVTHGYIGADLMQLARAALLNAIRRTNAATDDVTITNDDFDKALSQTRPSQLNTAESTVSYRTAADSSMVGLQGATAKLRAILVSPYSAASHRSLRLSDLGVSLPRGVLIHGPTGCGKTRLALAVAHESPLPLLIADATQLRSKVVGDSERAMARLFAQARQLSPCIIFFDPLEAFAPVRTTDGDVVGSRTTASLLTEMDGVFRSRIHSAEPQIIVVGVTSDMRRVDPAVLRPGRLDQRIQIPSPDVLSRRALFLRFLPAVSTGLWGTSISSDQELDKLAAELATATDGRSGADIEAICREASMQSLRETLTAEQDALTATLSPQHVWGAITTVIL